MSPAAAGQPGICLISVGFEIAESSLGLKFCLMCHKMQRHGYTSGTSPLHILCLLN